MSIEKNMLISDILEMDPQLANVLVQKGMHCVHCEAAAGETLQEACFVHGIDEAGQDALVAQLNDFLAGPAQES